MAMEEDSIDKDRSGRPNGPSETSPLIDRDTNGRHSRPWENGSPQSSDTSINTGSTFTSTSSVTISPELTTSTSQSRHFFPPLTTTDRVLIMSGILIVGWSYGLDGLLRYTYQSYAASSFGEHTLLSTINVLRSVVAAAAYPPAAKIADVFGRFELMVVSVVLYVVGTTIESIAPSIQAFITGAVLYQAGYTCIVLLTEVIIADITSMRSRVFFSYVPAIPFLANTWISGTLASASLKALDWRWGIGIWSPIYVISSVPLLVGLYRVKGHTIQAINDDYYYDDRPSWFKRIGRKAIEIFHHLDVIGLGLMIAALALILTPLTLAEGQSSRWRDPSIVIPLVLGLVSVLAFFRWETDGARHPFIPGHLLKDRGVGTSLGVRCLLNIVWALQGNYLYTVLIVAFDFSVSLSTQISCFFTFFGVLSGLVIGAVIFRARRLKIFVVVGTCLFLASLILLTKYHSGTSTSARTGMICAQVLLGLAAGFCAYPTQTSIQAATSHKHVSALTGVYLASFNVGSALGTCLSGVIWSENLLPALVSNLSPFEPNPTLAEKIYRSPFEIVPSYPVGTEIRSAIISSYGHVEWLLCIAGTCLCVPMILCALLMTNPVLSTKHTQPEAERDLSASAASAASAATAASAV